MMPAVQHNLRLNELLILLRYSLVSYVAECGPWSDRGALAAREALDHAVQEQREWIERIAELLAQRQWQIDPGTYPEEFTDSNYAGLAYLWPRILEDQRFVVTELSEAAHECAGDADAARLLQGARDSQQLVLDRLCAATSSLSAS